MKTGEGRGTDVIDDYKGGPPAQEETSKEGGEKGQEPCEKVREEEEVEIVLVNSEPQPRCYGFTISPRNFQCVLCFFHNRRLGIRR